ncbi:Voltage-dependent calcium channel subunit alpha-2/delta-4 [Branchiostoma belcheri]|nr:Voltage-dependent calcium channel subunit alpha-2/delta-4 [Branchiostoma belcheri]
MRWSVMLFGLGRPVPRTDTTFWLRAADQRFRRQKMGGEFWSESVPTEHVLQRSRPPPNYIHSGTHTLAIKKAQTVFAPRFPRTHRAEENLPGLLWTAAIDFYRIWSLATIFLPRMWAGNGMPGYPLYLHSFDEYRMNNNWKIVKMNGSEMVQKFARDMFINLGSKRTAVEVRMTNSSLPRKRQYEYQPRPVAEGGRFPNTAITACLSSSFIADNSLLLTFLGQLYLAAAADNDRAS